MSYAAGADGILSATNRQAPSAPPIFSNAAGGLYSTADDYMTFARMLLNKGKLGSVRIISRPSVEMMTRDYLTEEAPQTFFVRKEYFLDAGFGYGLQVQNRQTGYGPNPGAYWWHGATGVAWGTDPKEQLIYVRLIQRMGVYGPFVGDFMTALYAAIDD